MAAPPPQLTYTNFRQYVAQTMYAAQLGTVPAIPNALATASLDTAILTDPVKIRAFRESVAGQLNDQSGGPRFEDLSERIADAIITTTAQGAGTLEVHIIDPYWLIPTSGFIQADEQGYLLPVDVSFPTGTDCVWRLCQYRPSWSAAMQGANLVLTFEDRIVSLMREVSPGNGGIQQGHPNQTLAAFFAQLVDSANQILKPDPPITFVPLISPEDPNATVQITQVPKNAEKKLKPTGLSKQLSALLNYIDSHFNGGPVTYGLGGFPSPPPAAPQSTTLTAAEQEYAAQWAAYTRELEQAIARGDSNLEIPVAAP